MNAPSIVRTDFGPYGSHLPGDAAANCGSSSLAMGAC